MQDRKAGAVGRFSLATASLCCVRAISRHCFCIYDKGVSPFVKRYVIYPFPGKRASLVACICKYQNRDFAQTVELLRSFGHGDT
jgi:hypothetical protein